MSCFFLLAGTMHRIDQCIAIGSRGKSYARPKRLGVWGFASSKALIELSWLSKDRGSFLSQTQFFLGV